MRCPLTPAVWLLGVTQVEVADRNTEMQGRQPGLGRDMTERSDAAVSTAMRCSVAGNPQALQLRCLTADLNIDEGGAPASSGPAMRLFSGQLQPSLQPRAARVHQLPQPPPIRQKLPPPRLDLHTAVVRCLACSRTAHPAAPGRPRSSAVPSPPQALLLAKAHRSRRSRRSRSSHSLAAPHTAPLCSRRACS